MNKPSMFIIGGTALLAMALFIYNFDEAGVPSQQEISQSKHHSQERHGPSQKTMQSDKAEYNFQSPYSGHSQSYNDGEAGFDFTPYVSKKMADEIRPYTSRSTKGLEVKVDNDGNEYVDLKKRWSHATVSVIDENGKKHTGEWAPK
jgi:hypothetical protein